MDKNINEKKIFSPHVKWGLTAFCTVVGCIVFFFLLWRFQGFADVWKKFFKAGEPIIIGLVLAYLLNPVLKFVEEPTYKFFRKRVKSEKTAKKTARIIGIIVSVLFLIVCVALLIAAIVPSIVQSVSSLMDTLPGNVEKLISNMREGKFGNEAITEQIAILITKVTEYLENWVETDLAPKAQEYVSHITSGVISFIRTLVNCIIGIVVMVYVMMIKDTLIGQSKKMLYAVFRPKQANIIVETLRKTHQIFGGFITGKLLDSAIIGLICYIGCCIFRIPNAMLVAVIIGVTNVIPIFGPFIGAVPAILLVVIQSPWHALYLAIFILVLQQVDGNIIGPTILGESTGLSTFWVMFAILVFGGVFGFGGMLFGVPTFAVIYYLSRKIINYNIRKKNLPEETEKYVNMISVDEKTNEMIYKTEEDPGEEEETENK